MSLLAEDRHSDWSLPTNTVPSASAVQAATCVCVTNVLICLSGVFSAGEGRRTSTSDFPRMGRIKERP